MKAVKTHGLSHAAEYKAWQHMKERCFNPTNPRYPSYGGRGIGVCVQWMDFARFLSDMGPKPPGRFSLERKDNNGDYAPSNCVWADDFQQSKNTRRNHYVEAFGKRLHLEEWGRRIGLTASTLRFHLKRGKSMETVIRLKAPHLEMEA